jgi:hypothetical protein
MKACGKVLMQCQLFLSHRIAQEPVEVNPEVWDRYGLTESLLRDHLATRDHEPGILDVANIMQGIAVHRQQLRRFARRENA